MKKMVKMSMAAVMMMGIGSVSAQAEEVDILSNIKAKGEIRARYEMVDQDKKDNANAFTNRLTIGVGADLLGTDWLSAYAEMTDVHALNDNYNSTSNGQINHATVADPEQTRLTQAYIDVKMGKTLLRAGRQMVNLDNQRFIGAVGWRQMPQTYDALVLVNNDVENLALIAAYVTQVMRVFDDSTAAGSLDTRSVILHADYKVMDELKITAYAYMLGAGTGATYANNLNGEIGAGSDTYGIALTGDVKAADGVKVSYRAEYAKQTDATMENSAFVDASPSLNNVDADYMNFELNANVSGILAGVRYEVLSGTNGADGNTAFSTPLATLHGQNGWADMFLTTPKAGLEDINIMLGYTSKDFGKLQVIYHDFQSEVGSTDYGTEIDAVYSRAIPGVNNLSGMLKFADFNADSKGGYVDTTKFWVMLDYKFASK